MSGTEPLVWVNGALLPAAEARISALDQGFRSGIGVFETFRVRSGRVLRLSAHLERLRGAAEALGIALDAGELRTAVAAVTTGNLELGPDLVVRLTCSAGPLDPLATFPGASLGTPAVVATAHRAPCDPPAPARVRRTEWQREPARWKTTSYLVSVLAQQQAREAGATDAVLCDAAGDPLEAATANLFLLVDGALITPPVDAGVLPGITREVVLGVAAQVGQPVSLRRVTTAELHAAGEVFLTSAVRGVVPVAEVDGRPVRGGAPGPVTTAVTEAYDILAVTAAESVALS